MFSDGAHEITNMPQLHHMLVPIFVIHLATLNAYAKGLPFVPTEMQAYPLQMNSMQLYWPSSGCQAFISREQWCFKREFVYSESSN